MPRSNQRVDLEKISASREEMISQVIEWANINSHTENRDGVEKVGELVFPYFAAIAEKSARVPTKPYQILNPQGLFESRQLADALHFVGPEKLGPRLFFCIHLDTVYPKSSPFQECRWLSENRLNGPGVLDAKGGVVVMLHALRALTQTRDDFRWQVVLNPDEEIGSPASRGLLEQVAKSSDFGILFEPATRDGGLVSYRKGSANLSILVRGKSAHSGRNFHEGRNAIVHLAKLIDQIDKLQGKFGECTLNVARIDGGGANNVVPDLAIGRINIRMLELSDGERMIEAVRNLVEQFHNPPDYSCELIGKPHFPPRPLTPAIESMLLIARSAGDELGIPISFAPSGGASDGNYLAALGLPNVDNFGPRGDFLHSPDEYVEVDSFAERTKLTIRFVEKLVDSWWEKNA